jgi:O-antigen/teichoic acid export membrane protein
LGPTQFGVISYAQSIATIIIVISGLGFEAIIIKALVDNQFPSDEILSTALILKLIAALIVLSCLSVVLMTNHLDFETNLLIFTISLSAFFVSFNIVDCYFQAKVLSKFTVFSNIIAFSLVSLFRIIFILNHASILAFAVLNLVEFILIAIFLIYFYQKNAISKLLTWRFNSKIAKYFISTGWPLTISVSFAVVLDRIDQVMIKSMLGSEAVGHYVAASRLSEVWYFVGLAVVSTLFPAVLNAYSQDLQRYQRRMQRLFDLLIILSVMLAIPVSIFSEQIIALIYGKAYEDSAIVLAIHIWTALFVFLKAASANWLVINHMQIFSLYRNILAVVINVCLNYALIPIYGIAGSAISMLITLFIVMYLLNAVTPATRPCFMFQTKALFLQFLFRKEL